MAVALRHPHDERDSDRLLVRQHLHVVDPVLAEEQPVVRDEQEHGATQLAAAAHRVEDAAHTAVDAPKRLERALPPALDLALGLPAQKRLAADERRLVPQVLLVEGRRAGQLHVREGPLVAGIGDRAVRPLAGVVSVSPSKGVGRTLVELEEERLSSRRVRVHELRRPPVEHPGHVVGIADPAVLDRPVDEVVVVVVGRVAHDRVPLVPPGRDLRRGIGEVLVLVEELSDVEGRVAGVVQPHRQHVALVDQRRIGGLVRGHPMVVGVLTGQQAGS